MPFSFETFAWAVSALFQLLAVCAYLLSFPHVDGVCDQLPDIDGVDDQLPDMPEVIHDGSQSISQCSEDALVVEGRGRGPFRREARRQSAADGEACRAASEAPARARRRRESFRTLAHRLIFTQVLDTIDRWVKHVSKEATFAADYVNALVVIARRRKA